MPYVAGWSVLDNGKAEILNAAITSDVAYNAGAAFTQAGKRYGIAYGGSLAAGSVQVNGTSHTGDGRMYYVTSLPSPAHWVNGVVHNSAGAMYVDSAGAAVTSIAGIGVTDAGALTVSIT